MPLLVPFYLHCALLVPHLKLQLLLALVCRRALAFLLLQVPQHLKSLILKTSERAQEGRKRETSLYKLEMAKLRPVTPSSCRPGAWIVRWHRCCKAIPIRLASILIKFCPYFPFMAIHRNHRDSLLEHSLNLY